MFVASFFGSPPMNFFEGKLLVQNGELQFQVRAVPQWPSLRIKGDARRSETLGRHIDQPVVLGIRPEKISLSNNEQESLPALVELAEPLGAETFVYVRMGDCLCTARVPGMQSWPVGAKVALELEMSSAQLFDPQSQRRIC